MKICKKQLIEMNACGNGLQRFIEQTEDTEKPVDVVSLIGGKNTYSDLMWLACRKLPKEKVVKFACDCALINIELIKPYTNEYEKIVNFLKNPTAYAGDANSAVYAYAAAYAAYAAYPNTAAYAAAYAGDANTAAYAAPYAAASVNQSSKTKVDALLIELFNQVEKEQSE